MQPDFRNFAGRYQPVIIVHSAKGTTWKKHKYLKVIDGKYYYADDYEDGRHLSNLNKSSKSSDNDEKKIKRVKEPSDSLDSGAITKTDDGEERISRTNPKEGKKLPDNWQEELYDAIDKQLKKNPGLFDPKDLTDDDKFQDFRITLEEFTGIDSSELSDSEIEEMKKHVKNHYQTEPPKGWEEEFYDAIDKHLKRNPGLFDPKDITNEDKFQDFGLTIAEFTGIDTSNFSDAEINKMKKAVEKHYGGSSNSLSSEEIDKIARDVIRGKYGNGSERKKKLGSNYQAVQDRVNEMSSGKASTLSKDDVDKMAKDVISGKYGNGQERKAKLGDDYQAVQKRVNEMLSGSKGNTKVSEVKVTSKAKNLIDKAMTELKDVKISSTSASTPSKPNLDEVYSVYNKKKKK